MRFQVIYDIEADTIEEAVEEIREGCAGDNLIAYTTQDPDVFMTECEWDEAEG